MRSQCLRMRDPTDGRGACSRTVCTSVMYDTRKDVGSRQDAVLKTRAQEKMAKDDDEEMFVNG